MQQYDALYDNDWSLLVSFLPDEWREKAIELGAIERFRAFPDVDSLLRTLLALAAEGLSFRDGAARATWWGCANVSDVAIFKRLKAAGSWLQWIAESMMEQWGNTTPWEWLGPDSHLKVNDATTVQEPGSKGTTWRLHYSMGLPSLSCAELHLTGQKVGESFMRFSVSPGDVFMGDRGYAHASGVAYVVLRGGNVLVRVNLYCMRFFDEKGERIPLLQRLTSLSNGEIGDWDVWVSHNKKLIPGRICAQRLSEEDQQKALSRVLKKAAKQGRKLKPETLEAAKYIMVFTTLDHSVPAEKVLGCYRWRWQVELVFKRLKSLLGLGHLRRKDTESARAWIYAKLVLAFLIESIQRAATSSSPGDTNCRHKRDIENTDCQDKPKRDRTVWRETRMIFDAVKHCLYTVKRKLSTCLSNWGDITHKLSEPPRKRTPQLVHINRALLEPG